MGPFHFSPLVTVQVAIAVLSGGSLIREENLNSCTSQAGKSYSSVLVTGILLSAVVVLNGTGFGMFRTVFSKTCKHFLMKKNN